MKCKNSEAKCQKQTSEGHFLFAPKSEKSNLITPKPMYLRTLSPNVNKLLPNFLLKQSCRQIFLKSERFNNGIGQKKDQVKTDAKGLDLNLNRFKASKIVQKHIVYEQKTQGVV